jgi:hypothetical protein
LIIFFLGLAFLTLVNLSASFEFIKCLLNDCAISTQEVVPSEPEGVIVISTMASRSMKMVNRASDACVVNDDIVALALCGASGVPRGDQGAMAPPLADGKLVLRA